MNAYPPTPNWDSEEKMIIKLNLKVKSIQDNNLVIISLTKNGCMSFLMSDTGMSAPATPSKCAMRVLRKKSESMEH